MILLLISEEKEKTRKRQGSKPLKSGSALGLGFGGRLYFASLRELYPNTVGGDFGGIDGFSMGGVVCKGYPPSL